MSDATTYEDLRAAIQGVLDRDGQHDWDETARLAEIATAKAWNEIHEFPFADSLDAAWAEAEAALPEGWDMRVSHTEAEAFAPFPGEWYVAGEGPTPAAALRALAEKLRERAG